MDRHMLHHSPVGFSNVPVPQLCIELGAVVCSLLCPYVIGKQIKLTAFCDLVPLGACRSRREEECHQAVAVSLLLAVFTVDVVFMRTLPEAETQTKTQLVKVKKQGLLVVWC